MKILIGLDDSPFSEAAVEFVAKMRWPAGSTVLAASVLRPFQGGYAEPYVPESFYSASLMKDQRDYHEGLVEKAALRLRAAGISTTTRVFEGDPREVLVAAAADDGFDLLVVGSHGRTGLAKLLLGSVASHVVEHARCSVLVVKQAA
jgi:nucleotide-binding universal stress UspA family protein